jgi:hypothetical protein
MGCRTGQSKVNSFIDTNLIHNSYINYIKLSNLQLQEDQNKVVKKQCGHLVQKNMQDRGA